jgi:hypothetical protein
VVYHSENSRKRNPKTSSSVANAEIFGGFPLSMCFKKKEITNSFYRDLGIINLYFSRKGFQKKRITFFKKDCNTGDDFNGVKKKKF